jgi:metal-dependent amidase/aminoacylase/carboxypeptidase family protein
LLKPLGTALMCASMAAGGHSSQPQNFIDPIIIASYTIARLQTNVSRVVAPSDAVVVSVGSIHAGKTENVILDYCDLKLNIRTYDPDVKKRVVDSMRRIVNSEAEASFAPSKPSIKATTTFPVTENDESLVSTIRGAWGSYFDSNQVIEQEVLAGSEDLPNLAVIPPGKAKIMKRRFVSHILIGILVARILRNGMRR